MSKLKTMITSYCDDKKIDVDSFDGTEHPDAPKWPGICCRKPVLMSDLKEKLDEVNEQIKLKEGNAKGDGEGTSEEKDAFTGVVFVIMKTPNDAQKVLDGQRGWCSSKCRGFWLCCFGSKVDSWIFERAPEPTDIYWENLGIGSINRFLSAIWSWILTVALIIGCLVIISIIKTI